MDIESYTMSKCLGECRYRRAHPNEVGPLLVLQQLWQVIRYENSAPVGTSTEWRDIPAETRS